MSKVRCRAFLYFTLINRTVTSALSELLRNSDIKQDTMHKVQGEDYILRSLIFVPHKMLFG